MKKFKYLVDCECIRLSIIMASYLQSFGKREELKFNINNSSYFRKKHHPLLSTAFQ